MSSGTRFRKRALQVWVLACALAGFRAPCEARQSNNTSALVVPPGTILPVRLTTSLSTAKSKPGEQIRALLMQEVPLAGGLRIPRHSKLFGKLIAVSPAAAGGSQISLRFDTVQIHGQLVPVRTSLRAIAGFVEVDAAHLPTMSSGEGEVYDWLPTVQIGGEDVFGVGGPVTRWNNPDEVVGRETPDGLLGRVNARQGTPCRGQLYGNNAPQAFWVFSSDACGVYGMAQVTIVHAGRSSPLGSIVLGSSSRKLQLPSGVGMLLRVQNSE